MWWLTTICVWWTTVEKFLHNEESVQQISQSSFKRCFFFLLLAISFFSKFYNEVEVFDIEK